MTKQHDTLAIIACVVCILLALWLIAQMVRSTFADNVHTSSEHLGGVIYLGDRVLNANP